MTKFIYLSGMTDTCDYSKCEQFSRNLSFVRERSHRLRPATKGLAIKKYLIFQAFTALQLPKLNEVKFLSFNAYKIIILNFKSFDPYNKIKIKK